MVQVLISNSVTVACMIFIMLQHSRAESVCPYHDGIMISAIWQPMDARFRRSN